MAETETLEGVIKKFSDSEQFGKDFQLEGRKDYFKESQYGEDWPALREGMRVRFKFTTAKNGKPYVKGEDITILDQGSVPPSTNGYSDRNTSIEKQVALKLAVEIVKAEATSEMPPVDVTQRIIDVTRELYEGVFVNDAPNDPIPDDEPPIEAYQ